MPKPISRRELIRRLRSAGWEGPYPGGSHMVMTKDSRRITIPNPHRGDIDWSLAKQIISQAGIDRKDWENLGK